MILPNTCLVISKYVHKNLQIFFLSSGGYNFKINCLKEIRNKSSYLADQFDVIPIAIECYFWLSRSKCYEKAVTFYPEIFEFKVFVRQNN